MTDDPRLDRVSPLRYNVDMTQQERELVRKFKSLLSERLQAGFELFVFGSRARGDADDESDLDVLVVTQEPETYEVLMLVSGCAWEAALGSGMIINSVVFSRDAWENGPERDSDLARTVKEEGIPV